MKRDGDRQSATADPPGRKSRGGRREQLAALDALQRTDGSWILQLNRLLDGGRTDLVGIRAGDQPVFQDLSRALAAAQQPGRKPWPAVMTMVLR